MIKGIIMLGAGLAAVSLARFCSQAIAEERRRRDALRQEHDTTRWEGEGGNALAPEGGLGNVGAAV